MVAFPVVSLSSVGGGGLNRRTVKGILYVRKGFCKRHVTNEIEGFSGVALGYPLLSPSTSQYAAHYNHSYLS